MSPPRFHIPPPHSRGLAAGARLSLPPAAARHAQVLRLQPGHAVTLFDGAGGQWLAHIVRMGRAEVEALVQAHQPLEREAARAVHLAVGLMAADRMDWLAEKATELGAASLRPLLAERSSLRLSGERADKKRAHWQAVTIAACEQSGRNRLLDVRQQLSVQEYLDIQAPLPSRERGEGVAPASAACLPLSPSPSPARGEGSSGAPAEPARWLLSLDDSALPLAQALAALAPGQPVALLSGPEGGLTPAEEAAARAAGYQPISLGQRVLRAETAPLAALAALTLD